MASDAWDDDVTDELVAFKEDFFPNANQETPDKLILASEIKDRDDAVDFLGEKLESTSSSRVVLTIPPGISPESLLGSPVAPNFTQQQSGPSVNASLQSGTPEIDHIPAPDNRQDGEADQKGEIKSATAGTQAEDGYYWKKYGQKHVKGSKYPRYYYKCTHLNCRVKKTVELSQEGSIREINYKGSHNHPRPPATGRHCGFSHLDDQHVDDDDNSEQPGSQASSYGQDWRNDGLETSSAPLVTAELGNPAIQECPRLSSDGTDVSSAMPIGEEEDDEDETEFQRRKLEGPVTRIAIEITSEVDILEDGYRWRKYGQKAVGGNPNPRSYYKCTHPGCTIRKFVERAPHDLSSVITIYEGRHNHCVPATTNRGSDTSVSQPHTVPRRGGPMQDGFVRFGSQQTLGAYGLPGLEQLIPPTGFVRFDSQQTLGAYGLPGLEQLIPPTGFVRFDSQQTLGAYGLPGLEQLIPPTGFSLAMPPPGLGADENGPSSSSLPEDI